MFQLVSYADSGAEESTEGWSGSTTISYKEQSRKARNVDGLGRERDYAISGELSKQTKQYKTQFTASYTYGEQGGAGTTDTTDDEWELGNVSNYFMGEHWFIGNKFEIGEDEVNKVSSLVELLGYGYRGAWGEKLTYTIIPGVGYVKKQRETFADENDFVVGFMFSCDYAFNDIVTLSNSMLFTESIDGEDSYFETDITLNVKITKHVSITTEYTIENDTYVEAPYEENQRSLTVGLTVTY